MKVTLQLVLLGLIAVAFTQATRRRSREQIQASLPEGDYNSWDRRLSSSVTVKEFGFISSEHDVIIVRSHDNASAPLGYSGATFYYGFESDEPVLVIGVQGQGRGRPCFITTPEIEFDDLEDDILARNNTEIGLPDTTMGLEFLRGRPMSRQDARTFANANPLIRRVCRRLGFLDTRAGAQETSNEAAATEQPPRVIRTLGFEDIIEITVPGGMPSGSSNSRRGGRRGGRLGGRRGGRRQN